MAVAFKDGVVIGVGLLSVQRGEIREERSSPAACAWVTTHGLELRLGHILAKELRAAG